MGDHLDRRPGERDRLGSLLAGHRRARRGQPEDDVAHVVDAGVGDQALQVRLSERNKRAVDDRDRGQDADRERELRPRIGHHRHEDPDEPVGPHLEEDAGKDGRRGTGSVDVRRRQPGVKRHQRRLDGEADEESGEHEPGVQAAGREGLLADDLGHVERPWLRHEVQAEDGEQQGQRAGERVDEELQRRALGVAVPPRADQEVHRDERHVPEDEEEEEVEREEQADRGPLEEQHQGEVRDRPAAEVDRVGDRHHKEQRGHRGQGQRQTVDADLVPDPERGDPVERLDLLERTGPLEAEPRDDDEPERKRRDDGRDHLHSPFGTRGEIAPPGQEGERHRGEDRDEDGGTQHDVAPWGSVRTTVTNRRPLSEHDEDGDDDRQSTGNEDVVLVGQARLQPTTLVTGKAHAATGRLDRPVDTPVVGHA